MEIVRSTLQLDDEWKVITTSRSAGRGGDEIFPTKNYTLRGLFEFLDSQGEHTIIAIDEFQQIRDYPEQNIEALLRTYIQQTHNLTFIKIPETSYSDFIRKIFADHHKSITDEALMFILDWTRRHTYYTQQLCNTIYANGSVQQITASAFLKDHNIGSPSVSRRLADALCEKGLIFLTCLCEEDLLEFIEFSIGGGPAGDETADGVVVVGLSEVGKLHLTT